LFRTLEEKERQTGRGRERGRERVGYREERVGYREVDERVKLKRKRKK
jgi:hypothetical protein